jgi:hypothetical protein
MKQKILREYISSIQNNPMKKAKKIQNKEAYSSPEIDAFLALEETINTDYIRTSMLLAAQIEDAMLAKGFSKKQSPLSKDVI